MAGSRLVVLPRALSQPKGDPPLASLESHDPDRYADGRLNNGNPVQGSLVGKPTFRDGETFSDWSPPI